MYMLRVLRIHKRYIKEKAKNYHGISLCVCVCAQNHFNDPYQKGKRVRKWGAGWGMSLESGIIGAAVVMASCCQALTERARGEVTP